MTRIALNNVQLQGVCSCLFLNSDHYGDLPHLVML